MLCLLLNGLLLLLLIDGPSTDLDIFASIADREGQLSDKFSLNDDVDDLDVRFDSLKFLNGKLVTIFMAEVWFIIPLLGSKLCFEAILVTWILRMILELLVAITVV